MLRKTHCLCKEPKNVKNGLFWCIVEFYATKLRIAGKTHYLSKELKCQKLVILVYSSVLCTNTQKCRENTIFVKTSYICVFKVFYEKKTISIKNFAYSSFNIVLLQKNKIYENKLV
ncbi:hypothetical protein E2C01_091514 [Portunus trituberculatus]|uniref:Uncharacterized protein n=1 Tax=Portunus trituberculatus TaxID=210409 RepID=A0A5B7JNT1_PORTR|nr:hypothetical protein [Portunus trituberculatus]